MKLKELVHLCVLQKDYHQKDSTKDSHPFVITRNALKQKYAITAEEVMAPSLFPNQPAIPFVLFKPGNTGDKKIPLIIHTHGGPHVYMDKNVSHAEILYYVSHGFAVACPNYRGSSDYPEIGDDKKGWEKWKNSKENLHTYGPEDVYAVASYVRSMPEIDASRTVLRGGSFGSFINAHLMAQVARGKFKNIFIGAHFSGGVKYPHAFDMPSQFPILISHSTKDEIAPYSDAGYFMEKCLLRAAMSQETAFCVQTFISYHGDHHLIDPELALEDEHSDSYLELVQYLSLSTRFLHDLIEKGVFISEDPLTQCNAVMSNPVATGEDLADKSVRSLKAIRYVQSLELPVAADPPLLPKSNEASLPFCPTLAHLKLQLGEAYTGNIESDLRVFFKKHFSPINWTLFREQLHNAGQRILENTAFFNQMVEITSREKDFLDDHPEYMVIYHAAQNNVLQLYTFINMWKNILNDQSPTHLPALTEMRMFEFIKNSVEDIQMFLIKMRNRKNQSAIFNNIPGFADIAGAFNPGLTFNSHNTASCGLWWYFDGATNERVDVELVIGNLFRLLGIYAPERVAIYKHFFETESETLIANGQKHAVMQQVLIPYDLTEQKNVYLCQMWGEEFAKNDIELDRPERIRDLCKDPVAFEQRLRENKEAFTNPGDCTKFGKTDEGFNYAASLQLRHMITSDASIRVNTYLRSQEVQSEFIGRLYKIMQLDFSDHLACPSQLSDAIIPGVNAVKLKHRHKLGFFDLKIGLSDDELYLQQLRLAQGLEQNPTKDWYRNIAEVSNERKANIQKRLRETKITKPSNSNASISLYALCLYLDGYVYHDLLNEMVESSLKKALESSSESEQTVINKHYAEMMQLIEKFTPPSSMNTENLSSNDYYIFSVFMRSLKDHQYNPEKHIIIQDGPEYHPGYVFDIEMWTAVECILRHASICKDKQNGLDRKQKQFALF